MISLKSLTFLNDTCAPPLNKPVNILQLISSGRNRYNACTECGIEPQCKEWDGVGSLVEYVVSLNLKRRDLTKSQRGAIGLEVEEMLGREAKERQRQAGGDRKSQEYKQKSLVEKIPQPVDAGKARDQAAKIVGTNPHYITDAKAVKKQSPDLAFPLLKEGKIMVLPQTSILYLVGAGCRLVRILV